MREKTAAIYTLGCRVNRYEGIVVDLTVDRVLLPDGKESFREVVDHPGGVCVLPVDDEGYAYCVRQYRYAVGAHLIEAPAGKLERGENPEKYNYVQETLFSSVSEIKTVTIGGNTYDVDIVK